MMNIQMASLPGGGLGGGGGFGAFVGRSSKHTVSPQVTLNMSVNPPVLDTGGAKPPPAKSSSSWCGRTGKRTGLLFSSFRNIYNSIVSGTPVTWVNPDMVSQFQPVTTSQAFYPDPQYPGLEASIVNHQSSPLWYSATPGSQFEYQDPLQSFFDPPFNAAPPAYTGEHIPLPKDVTQKPYKPLNPEAKEWVPSNFKDCKNSMSSIPECSIISQDEVQKPLIIVDASAEFEEITDNEVEEARKSLAANVPKIIQDHKVLQPNNQVKHSCSDISNTEVVVATAAQELKGSQLLPETSDTDTQKEDCGLSYASVARKSPQPPLKIKSEIALRKECVPAAAVKQPIPKIFLKDKKYPKEKAPSLMDCNKRGELLPFRTVNKTQKKRSKKFLKDLRESSPAKSDSSFSGSEGSYESHSDIPRLCVGSSSTCVGVLHPNLSPKDSTTVSCSTPRNVRSQRLTSESSVSSNIRTISESSTGSVESLDIEFGDDNGVENVCVITATCPSKSSSAKKHPNEFLAHILGFDDSESEDSDEETDDSDWDEVDNCESLVLESWETFGLSIPLMTKSLSCSKTSTVDTIHNSENVCDTDYFNLSLDDINKKWEIEVAKDIVVTSPNRVSFGGASVQNMVTWSYAYKTARRGPWEQYARDRARFNNRIADLETVLSPVLEVNHRNAVYRKLHED